MENTDINIVLKWLEENDFVDIDSKSSFIKAKGRYNGARLLIIVGEPHPELLEIVKKSAVNTERQLWIAVVEGEDINWEILSI